MILFYFLETLIFKELLLEFGEPWMLWAALCLAIVMLMLKGLGETNANTR